MIEGRHDYEQHIEANGVPVFFNSQKPTNGAGEPEDWPEPKPLAGDLPPVRRFCWNCFPPAFDRTRKMFPNGCRRHLISRAQP